MSEAAQLTQSLKAEASRLGFHLAGACAAVAPPGYDRFRDWLDAGYAGEMHYLEERGTAYAHPRSVLDGVESLLMLGMSYQTDTPNLPVAGKGRVARYAWGAADYHDLIHQRLKQLKRFAIGLNPELSVRGVVDTAPLLEREFAQLAGIGWQAKNTLVINKQFGSYFLLAALLLDTQLVYDAAVVQSHCGTCTACLDACPTDAFVSAGVLDARKCISYLTIEHRTPIPDALREGMGDWILGCDVCQEVCPWNRKAIKSDEPAFAPLAELNPLELRSLFGLSDDEFRQRFRKSPLWRPKRRGILRNAAIALGNNPHANNLSALQLGLADDEPLVRGAAAWALGKHLRASRGAAAVLTSRLDREPDSNVRGEIEQALALPTN